MKLLGIVKFFMLVVDMGYGEGVIIVFEDDIFCGLGMVGVDIVNKSMDFDMVKVLMVVFIENIEFIYYVKVLFMFVIWYGEIDVEIIDMCGLNLLKYYLGVVVVWEEVGYILLDCVK